MTRVLVVSPHPDDESIGCGGTLARHAAAGDRVEVVFLTSGERGGHGAPPARVRRTREAEAARAAAALGAGPVEFWGAPDGALRATEELVRRLAARLRALRPDVVYTTHPGEMHPDHRASARLAARAAGELAPRDRPDLLGFEVWTPLARFDEIVDVTRFAAAKRAAIRRYRSQCAVVAFDAAMLGLARYRGELHCWPEGEYAEAFVRLRPVPGARGRR